MDELLEEVDYAMSGQLNLIDDLDYGSEHNFVRGGWINGDINEERVYLYEDEEYNESVTIPLTDWKEILLSLKEYLES